MDAPLCVSSATRKAVSFGQAFLALVHSVVLALSQAAALSHVLFSPAKAAGDRTNTPTMIDKMAFMDWMNSSHGPRCATGNRIGRRFFRGRRLNDQRMSTGFPPERAELEQASITCWVCSAVCGQVALSFPDNTWAAKLRKRFVSWA